MSPDDFIVESLFRYLFRGVFSDTKPIVVLNPDAQVQTRFNDMAGRTLDFCEEKFTLDSARRILSM